jgi:hypothetical protein
MSEIKWPEWQPIETAPKGDPVVRFLVVDKDDWMDIAQSDDDFDMWDFEPTKWMPLPPEPGGQIEEAKQSVADEVETVKSISRPDT